MDDERHGRGTLTCANGDVFEGVYEKGVRAGQGELRYADGSVDRGVWSGNTLVRLGGISSSLDDHDSFGDGASPVRPGPLTVACHNYLASVKAGDGVAIRLAMHSSGQTFVDASDEVGRTALHHAVLAGHVDVVRLLLSVGARPNHLTDDGHSILSDAYASLPSVLAPPLHRGPIDSAAMESHERNVRECILVLLDRYRILCCPCFVSLFSVNILLSVLAIQKRSRDMY
jgi:hypothetical protein